MNKICIISCAGLGSSGCDTRGRPWTTEGAFDTWKGDETNGKQRNRWKKGWEKKKWNLDRKNWRRIGAKLKWKLSLCFKVINLLWYLLFYICELADVDLKRRCNLPSFFTKNICCFLYDLASVYQSSSKSDKVKPSCRFFNFLKLRS